MKDLGLRENVIGQLRHPIPREAILLAAAPQRAQPEALDMVTEGAECRKVGRHGMVGKVTPKDLRQSTALFGGRLVRMRRRSSSLISLSFTCMRSRRISV
jgi:hypothetical protein